MNVCHVIDYLYCVTGLKATQVYSEYSTLGSPADVEDIVSVSFRLSNGGLGSISAREFHNARSRSGRGADLGYQWHVDPGTRRAFDLFLAACQSGSDLGSCTNSGSSRTLAGLPSG